MEEQHSRYSHQPGSKNIYLVRDDEFFKLETGQNSFTLQGTYNWPGNKSKFTMGGDSRKLYIAVVGKGSHYFYSDDEGANWTEKNPQVTQYGKLTDLQPGHYLCVHPEHPDTVLAGYINPVMLSNNLDNINDPYDIWGQHQLAQHKTTDEKHRLRIHADVQCSHFYYDKDGQLFSLRASDGGIYVSYNEWITPPTNDVYGPDIYYDLTLYNVATSEIYPAGMAIGKHNPDHVVYGTQDQGSHTVEDPGSDVLRFTQGPYGDGPNYVSADGEHFWSYSINGKQVYGCFNLYDKGGNFSGSSDLTKSNQLSLPGKFTYYVNAIADLSDPSGRMWLLNQQVYTVKRDGDKYSYSESAFSNSTNYVYTSAVVQSPVNPNKMWAMREGKVYSSTNKGDSWTTEGIETGMTKGNFYYTWTEYGYGWASPVDEDMILFAGRSGSNVTAVLSKDGGQTWNDVSGSFPSGYVHGMAGTPDGKFVFVSSQHGPWLFDVEEETFYDMAEGGAAPMFNGKYVEYIPKTKTVRFSTWGLGLWDFQINSGDPFVALNSPSAGEYYANGDILPIKWTTNYDDNIKLQLFKDGSKIKEIAETSGSDQIFNWTIPSDLDRNSNYSIALVNSSADTIMDQTSTFTIHKPLIKIEQNTISINYVDSEHDTQVAENLLDGNLGTIWHTQWDGSKPKFPHTVIFELSEIEELAAFEYTPRQDGGNNGWVIDYTISVSTDGSNWINVITSGVFSNNNKTKLVLFDNEVNAKYVKFIANSEADGDFYASGAEVNIYKYDSLISFTKEIVAQTSNPIKYLGIQNNYIKFSLPDNNRYTVRLTDLNGKLLSKQQYASSGKRSLPIPNAIHTKGQILILSITGNNKSLTKKLMISN